MNGAATDTWFRDGMIPKPPNFDGEPNSTVEWAFVFKAWLSQTEPAAWRKVGHIEGFVDPEDMVSLDGRD